MLLAMMALVVVVGVALPIMANLRYEHITIVRKSPAFTCGFSQNLEAFAVWEHAGLGSCCCFQCHHWVDTAGLNRVWLHSKKYTMGGSMKELGCL